MGNPNSYLVVPLSLFGACIIISTFALLLLQWQAPRARRFEPDPENLAEEYNVDAVPAYTGARASDSTSHPSIAPKPKTVYHHMWSFVRAKRDRNRHRKAQTQTRATPAILTPPPLVPPPPEFTSTYHAPHIQSSTPQLPQSVYNGTIIPPELLRLPTAPPPAYEGQ